MSKCPKKCSILYLSHCNSYHTIKWAKHFASAGYSVHIASLERCNNGLLNDGDILVHWLGSTADIKGSEINKIQYLTTIRKIKELIEIINPDIIHAHYASSYGLLCALACERPYYLSVWGSDVYDFPRKSPLHRLALTYSLRKCSWLFSTSRAMAEETSKYTDKAIVITPFGVDMDLFTPNYKYASDSNNYVIGTVKALEPKYGIGTLLSAVSILYNKRPDLNIRLRIAGKGSLENELKQTADRLGISPITTWLGYISQEEAAREWVGFDVGVVASESESFGVSAVECQACGTPLVISDVPGLMEACDGGATAVVVPRGNDSALACAIEDLADDRSRRLSMSERGREYVSSAYEVNSCFKKVEEFYMSNLGARP